MRDLTVAIVQDAIDWQKPAENRDRFAAALDRVDNADLVVLPEMFTTGFTMSAAGVAEPMDGPSVAWMLDQAEKKQAVVTGSLAIEEAGRYYNRLLWATPDGQLTSYDKRHLFRMAGEHEVYTAGTTRTVVQLHGWSVALFVCYDLRFPVWLRCRGDYDVAVFVANWPAPRHDAWETLLKARAMENQCYVVGVNRVGPDGNRMDYLGGSAVLDVLGRDLAGCGDAKAVASATLSVESLVAARERFPVAHDADTFEIL